MIGSMFPVLPPVDFRFRIVKTPPKRPIDFDFFFQRKWTHIALGLRTKWSAVYKLSTALLHRDPRRSEPGQYGRQDQQNFENKVQVRTERYLDMVVRGSLLLQTPHISIAGWLTCCIDTLTQGKTIHFVFNLRKYQKWSFLTNSLTQLPYHMVHMLIRI